jgi:hypothetical protein
MCCAIIGIFDEPPLIKKRRRHFKRVDSCGETPWGKLSKNPESPDSDSYEGKKFRRRFS